MLSPVKNADSSERKRKKAQSSKEVRIYPNPRNKPPKGNRVDSSCR